MKGYTTNALVSEQAGLQVTRELCISVDQAEVRGLSICVRSAQRNFPDLRAELVEIGGGVAAFTGVGSHLSYAVGVGTSAIAGDHEVAAVTRFFEDRGTTPKLIVHPLADVSLTRSLILHGYSPAEPENILAVDLRGFDAARDPRIAETRDLSAWAIAAALGFSDGASATEGDIAVGLQLATSDNVTALEGRDGGSITATSCCDVDAEFAGFFGGTTLVEYRNRGWQTAMIRDRAARAIEAGARYGRVTCRIGTTSERRYRALGFSVLYTRTLWAKA